MAMHQNLSKAFPLVAASLGRKFGVQVLVDNTKSTASTDSNVIILPELDTNNKELLEVLWGFLAHEAAHVRFSDFDIFKRVKISNLRKHILGIIEDVRIECEQIKSFPGTKKSILAVDDYFINKASEDSIYSPLSENANPINILGAYVLLKLRRDTFELMQLDHLLTIAEDSFINNLGESALIKLDALLMHVGDLKSTTDALALSDKILSMLEDEQDRLNSMKQSQQLPNNSSSCDSADDSDDSSNGSSGSSGSDSEDDLDDDSDDSSNGSSGSSSSDSEDDSDDSSNGSSGSSSSDSEDDLDDDSDDSSNGSSGSSGSDSEDIFDQQHLEALSRLLSDKDTPFDDVIDQLRNDLDSQKSHSSLSKMPVPNDFKGNGRISYLEEVRSESSRLKATLYGLVQSSKLKRDLRTNSGLHLDQRKLANLATYDDRVFLKRQRKKSNTTAIHLLVDASGSMGSVSMNIAAKASLALALALEKIPGVNPGVTCFPGSSGEDDEVDIILPHGQKVINRQKSFTISSRGCTPLTEALWYSASSVLSCKESRKVILVLTDGYPNDHISSVNIINRCYQSGIEIVGVGIDVDVSSLFKNSIMINDVKDLKTELFKLSKEVLITA